MTRIARASLIIAIFFGLDKFLGLLRQALFSRQFTEAQRDIFFAANNLPDFLSALISGGALGIALIPIMSEFLDKEGRQAAWALFTRVLNLAFIVTAAVALVGALLAGPLVQHIVVPGFEPAKQALTAELMRLDLIAIIIFSISGLVMAGLQANQHFVLPAIAPACYNLGQIFGLSVLAPSQGMVIGPLRLPAFGLGLHGLVYGVIIGAALHLAIQIPGLLKYQFRWAPAISLRHPGVQRVLVLMGPRVLTMACLQIYFVARDNLASRLAEGSVSALNQGWYIQQVPETLIGTAIAIALLPSLAEHITHQDQAAFRSAVNRALRAMLALNLPIAAVLAVGSQPVISRFLDLDAAGTQLVMWATRAFLLGLLGHTWLEIAVRSFYAQRDALRPLLAAAGQLAVFLPLAALLAAVIGVAGIALADTVAFTGQALFLLWLLNRRYPGVLAIGDTLWRALLGAGVGAALAWALLRFIPLPGLPLSLAALTLGGLASIPFIWKEVRGLLKL